MRKTTVYNIFYVLQQDMMDIGGTLATEGWDRLNAARGRSSSQGDRICHHRNEWLAVEPIWTDPLIHSTEAKAIATPNETNVRRTGQTIDAETTKQAIQELTIMLLSLSLLPPLLPRVRKVVMMIYF